MNIKMQTQSELISSSVLFLLNSFILDNFFRNGFLKHNANTDLYEVTSIIYKKKKEILMNSAIRSFKSVFDKKKHHFLEQSTNKNDLKTNLILIVAQIFELIGLATYKIKSGDEVNPKMDTLQKSSKTGINKGSCFLVLLNYRRQSILPPIECNVLKM
jgi:hypothetical protein